MSTQPEVTIRYDVPRIYTQNMCDPQETLECPAVEMALVYSQGDEAGALRALDEAYANLKRQITGMTTIVNGQHQEDE